MRLVEYEPRDKRVFSLKARVKSCFKIVSVSQGWSGCLLAGQSGLRNEPVTWNSRFDFEGFVIACTIGHLEQGIACAGRTRIAK